MHLSWSLLSVTWSARLYLTLHIKCLAAFLFIHPDSLHAAPRAQMFASRVDTSGAAIVLASRLLVWWDFWARTPSATSKALIGGGKEKKQKKNRVKFWTQILWDSWKNPFSLLTLLTSLSARQETKRLYPRRGLAMAAFCLCHWHLSACVVSLRSTFFKEGTKFCRFKQLLLKNWTRTCVCVCVRESLRGV